MIELRLGALRFRISGKWKHPCCARAINKQGRDWLPRPLSTAWRPWWYHRWQARGRVDTAPWPRSPDGQHVAGDDEGRMRTWHIWKGGWGGGKKKPTRSTTRMSSPGIMPASVFTAHAINCLVGCAQRENYKSGTSCQMDTTRFGGSKAQFQSLCCLGVCCWRRAERENGPTESSSWRVAVTDVRLSEQALSSKLPHYNRRSKVSALSPTKHKLRGEKWRVCTPPTRQQEKMCNCWAITSTSSYFITTFHFYWHDDKKGRALSTLLTAALHGFVHALVWYKHWPFMLSSTD